MTMKLEVAKRDAATGRGTLPAGHVPAVVYGPKQEPLAMSLDELTFDKVRKDAGESTIITLTGLGEELEVLIKQVDFNPIKQGIVHVDFYAIERGKEMTVSIPLEFVGEAPAEKGGIGTVTRIIQDVEVTCRPSDIPSDITVDVSTLATENDKITVGDLPKIEGVTYNAEAEDPVAVISVQKEEVEEEVVAEEGAEGEAPEAGAETEEKPAE